MPAVIEQWAHGQPLPPPPPPSLSLHLLVVAAALQVQQVDVGGVAVVR
jgi:hypothetical protein